MSFQTVVLQSIAQIQTRLNTIVANAKRIFELPHQTTLDPLSKFHVDLNGFSQYLTVQQVVDAAVHQIQTANLNSEKITLTAIADDQTVFLLPKKPENIDILFNDAFLTEGYAYTYDSLTGEITLTNGVPNGSELNVRTFTNAISTKQTVIATIDNQIVFNYSGAPSNIEVVVNDGFLTEPYGYSRTNYSVGNFITLTNGVPIGSSVQIRKF